MGGKSFKSQLNGWSCGILAVQNAILALGGEADYDTIRKLSRANSKEGTSTRGVIRALKELACIPVYYRTRNPDNAWRFARKWASSQPLICSMDRDSHWAVLSGVFEDKLILVDSGIDASGEDKGVFPISKSEVLKRWRSHDGLYKAIRVSRA